MRENRYDTAQICLSGHVINDKSVALPQHNQDFCDACGARTITGCQHCETPIRGYYHSAGWHVVGGAQVAPTFCHSCGQPYPWTDAKRKAARELVGELDDLSEEERDLLLQSIDDIVGDTPQTEVAATRFKKLAAKLGKGAADAFRRILVDIASESAKKVIWP